MIEGKVATKEEDTVVIVSYEWVEDGGGWQVFLYRTVEAAEKGIQAYANESWKDIWEGDADPPPKPTNLEEAKEYIEDYTGASVSIWPDALINEDGELL